MTEIETMKTIDKISETKSWVFEKHQQYDKLSLRMTKKTKRQSSNY